ncbi:MAG: hypothetical protein P1U87_18195 [Verrucomicrobiales bacterium]|nr:hypothetical protein [Verrucomicrobiales bacterium]
MKQFPYLTDYINETFVEEKKRFDYIFIRPILLVVYFFLRCIVFPLKYIFHRRPWGFEGYCIDGVLAFGLKYFASREAVELLIRHVQIEPILYRHLLTGHEFEEEEVVATSLNGIFGNFSVESLDQVVHNNMTIGHDQLSYELGEKFDREIFLENLDRIQASRPMKHQDYSKRILEVNREHSLGWFGATNVVMMIVYSITIFADLHTTVKALNSFDSDSILLWALKHLYQDDPNTLIDLDFYMQVFSNRSHYNSSAFFSDPSQYLAYHIVFDEFAYDRLQNHPPTIASS